MNARKRREKYFDARRCAPIEAIHPMTGKVFTVDFQKDAMIGHDIDEELVRLPGTISWYLQLREIAEAAYDDAKHRELNVMEDLSLRLRAQLEGKFTETMLKHHVNAHPKMRKAFRRRMRAERRYRALKAAVDVLIEKKWSIRSLVDFRRIDNNPDAL